MTEDGLDPVSADPSVYAGGGFYDSSDIHARLQGDPADPECFVREAHLYDRFSYTRPIEPAALVGPEPIVDRAVDAARQINARFAKGPASNLVRVRGCRILDRSLHVETSSGSRPLYETQRASDRPFLHQFGASSDAQELSSSAEYVILDSIGSFNYGHWLVDDLSRFRALLAAPRRAGRPLRVLMTRYDELIDGMREQSLRAVLPDHVTFEVELLERSRTYRAVDLLFPMPVSLHPALKNPSAIDDLVEATEAVIARSAAIPIPERSRKRLFVHRRRNRSRCLANETQIISRLERSGFRTIDPEGMSFVEQATYFSGADFVIGPMGAAMTNTIFCRPGARVLHLAASDWTDTFFWDLAAVRGQRYATVYGSEMSSDDATFEVDLAMIERALRVLNL